MRFVYTDGDNSDFVELCRSLDEFLNKLVDGEENRADYIPYNRLDDIHDVILAYDAALPVGSASFKKYDDACAEVKRVFVKQEYRGKGISVKLMELLENATREQGYRYLILESGEPLAAAMALYIESLESFLLEICESIRKRKIGHALQHYDFRRGLIALSFGFSICVLFCDSELRSSSRARSALMQTSLQRASLCLRANSHHATDFMCFP